MKKNGYVRRFLALFLTLMMIMADSSVTTFAATVGMVKQQNGDEQQAAEGENQKKVYTYEDSKVIVTATLENADAVPDNANFVVTKMNAKDHQDDYAYAEQMLKEYEEAENVLYDSYLIYDMHFEDENGNEIEPEDGQVSVNISYKKAQKLSEETTEDSVQVLHLDENKEQLEDVTDSVELNSKGKLEEVTLTTESFSIFVIASQSKAEIEVEPMTDYSLYNILNNYNTFARDSVTIGHSVGPVVAGGNYKGQWVSGNGYVHKVNSYIKGNASFYGYGPGTNSTYMYLGKINEWNYSGDQIRYTKNDDYIDFNEAFNSFESEIKSVGSSVSSSTVENNTLIAGKSYNIHLNDYCLNNGQLRWEKGTDTTSTDSVIYDDSDGTIYLRANAEKLGSAGSEYNPNGVGIAYLFPNAKKIVVSNWNQLMGHIVAPNAEVVFEGPMNYAGCIVCKSLNAYDSESHMWPYNGSKIRPTSTGFKATKTVDSTTPTESQKFKFHLSEYVKGSWQLIETKENNGSSIAFSEIGYSSDSQLGDHWYLISEDQDSVDGYSLSTNQYLIKVTVTKTTSGSDTTYNKEETYYKGPDLPEIADPDPDKLVLLSDKTEVLFNNTTNKGSLKIVKAAGNNTDLNRKPFYFKVTDSNNNVVKNGDSDVWSLTFNSASPENAINISELTPGEYTVTETDENGNAVTTSASFPYKVTGGGKVTVTAGNMVSVTVTNTLVAGTSITLMGTKNLTGRTLKENEFSFEAKDAAGNTVATGKNKADGTIRFGAISYSLSDLSDGNGSYVSSKEFTYTVSEVLPEGATAENKYTVNGITYDASKFTVKVTVSYDVASGTMSAALDKDSDKVAFTNSYDTKTSISLEGTKSLTGRNLKENEFSFEVKDADGNTVATGKNKADGTISFGALSYSLSDLSDGNGGYVSSKDFTYTVSEVLPEGATEENNYTVNGITYDTRKFTVKVTVSYDVASGTMSAALDKDSDKVAFTNSYDTKTSISLEGTKSLTGRNLKENEFSFEVKDADGNTVATGKNKADGTISFGALSYSLSDLSDGNGGYVSSKDFTYTVSEVLPEGATAENKYTVNGITYDASKFTVKVTVSYDVASGTMSAALDKDSDKVAFTNSYDTKTSISLEGTKSLTGRNLKENEFSFEVKDADGNTVATGKNKADGTISFGALSYSLSDLSDGNGGYVSSKDFTYTVSEVLPEGATEENNYTVNGITYDTSKFTVKVTVTYDAKTGTMSAALAEGTPGIAFSNTYTATGSTTITATKTLTGRSFQSGDNWTFTVTASPTTAPMPEHPVITTSATSGNSETLDFGKINYTLKDVGTYVYTITESGNITNVENDPNTARTVKVIVTDNGDGTLKVEQKADATGLTFTNKYAEGETTLGVTKVLSGREFKAGDAWTFNLTADSETAPMPAETSVTTTATSGNSQSLTFGTIKYSLADVGNTYTYTITESGSGEGVTNDPNATRTVTVTVAEGSDGKLAITRTESEGGTVFTNTYNAAGSLTLEANKKLKNKTLEAGAFSFELKELTAENTKVLETVPNEANGSVNFTTINYTLADVGTHTYTVSEVKGDDGTVTYDGTIYTVEATVTDAGNGTLNVSKVIKKNGEKVDSIDFTNTYVGEIEIAGTKTWNDNNDQDGIRPTSITVNLFANGEKVKDQKVTPDGNGNWNYKFEKLLEYNENGKITYTVTEDAVEGYTTELDGNNFINTHVPETTEISGTKTWNDAEDQDGKRPESITVKLLANGEEVNSQTVTAGEDGSWNYSFTNLPKFADGQEITYTVSETPVEDYTTTYDGYNIINSYTPGQTSATITKLWADADNQDGIRPDSITVTLLADGKETGTTATLTAANNWTETITGLPEKANGKAIEYTWAEKDLPDGYELTDNSTDGTVTTLTNTHTTAVTSLSGTKTWEDADNQDGKRPESIIINLFADGKQIENKTVKADALGNWAYSFTNLPKFANGKEIVYTVTEDAVEGYTTKVDGNNFINSYKPETTEVSGTKTWNDAENQDGKRPESIIVRLLANGIEKDSQTVKADEAGSWTYKFTDLPKYEAGEEIVYTVTEDAVPDYTTEISGYDITNSYAPGKTSVTVTKAWVDNNNRNNHRPDAIKVQLKADGVNSGEEITLNAENNWTYTWSDLDQKKAGKDIAYTVEETGKAAGYISTVTGNAEEGFIITNTITSVKISKVDITDQKELAGAHIQILDKDGNVVDEWDSTWESHEVTGLKTGEKYTLRETVAPDGYTITADTVFSLKEDGTLDKDNTSTTISADGTLLVEDSRTSVKVSKVNISDGEELEGAHIQIIDQDGNVVDEWDSTKEAHVIEKLKTGKTYTLRETVAPDGYLLTSDTTFVLKEDGTVDAEKTTAVSKDGVLLVQDKLATSASIAVTKKLTYIGEGLAARNQTFYVALYSDKECTQRVSDVKALVFKNADASTVVFSENIKAGKTYYIAECTQDGTAQTIGALADGTVYEAVFGNGNSTTVTEVNGTTTVSFENVFSSFPPDGFYKQGQLTITKKVLGADGGTRNSNEVFYAGIFDDAAHTQLSQQVEQNIIKLDMDGGYEVSETINVGLAQSGAKVTLYVTETDSNGKPIAGSEGFGYKVTVSADSVTLDETNMTAEVVITNQEESTVTETPTPTPSSDGGNSGGSENHSGGYGGGKSPKTGDDTPIGTYLMLLLAAAMLAAETERRRRRNKRQ